LSLEDLSALVSICGRLSKFSLGISPWQPVRNIVKNISKKLANSFFNFFHHHPKYIN